MKFATYTLTLHRQAKNVTVAGLPVKTRCFSDVSLLYAPEEMQVYVCLALLVPVSRLTAADACQLLVLPSRRLFGPLGVVEVLTGSVANKPGVFPLPLWPPPQPPLPREPWRIPHLPLPPRPPLPAPLLL